MVPQISFVDTHIDATIKIIIWAKNLTMNKMFLLFAVLLIAASASVGYGQSVAGISSSATENKGAILPLSEVREGMRGTARSVFRGTEPEEFNVEILGVIPNVIGPKQDMIVGRLSGANAERTFVFAGMSGSPVYIDGKLVGAISCTPSRCGGKKPPASSRIKWILPIWG